MPPGLKAIEAAAAACVLDAARLEGLPAVLESLGAEASSLYSGPGAADLADVAPYLVGLVAGSPFSQWVLGEAWGRSGGILIVSEVGLDELRNHFRHFLMVIDEAGKALYFRFYDPRVLRIFLPTCDAEQLRALFGPITAFVVEDEDPGKALRFTLAGGDLVTETIDLAKEGPSGRPRIEWKGRG